MEMTAGSVETRVLAFAHLLLLGGCTANLLPPVIGPGPGVVTVRSGNVQWLKPKRLEVSFRMPRRNNQ